MRLACNFATEKKGTKLRRADVVDEVKMLKLYFRISTLYLLDYDNGFLVYTSFTSNAVRA